MAERSKNRASNTAGLIPFKPGQSGNPGGRPKGLAREIQHATKNGKELVEFYLAKFREGKAVHQFEAAKWLTERGFGKSPEIVANLNLNEAASKDAESYGASLMAKGILIADDQSKHS